MNGGAVNGTANGVVANGDPAPVPNSPPAQISEVTPASPENTKEPPPE